MESLNLKSLLAAFLALSFTLGTVGCNTVEGMGRDIERAGDKIEGEAREHK